jgi:hypothetical protein
MASQSLTGVPRLTNDQIDELVRLLDVNHDRGGFYLAYYNFIKPFSPSGAEQVLLQAQISTYSGFFGGGALIGNAIRGIGVRVVEWTPKVRHR